MKQLAVTLAYSASDDHGGRSRGAPVALPLRVLDGEGGLLGEGAASGQRPQLFEIADDQDTVFVRLTWPSGKTETQRVELAGRARADVAFTDAAIARNEWSAWAVPRLNARSALARPEPGAPTGTAIGAYDRVWLRLWRHAAGGWQPEPMMPTAQYRNEAARQIDLELDAQPWMLQIGGAAVPWRLVSLPGGGACRVLLTPSDSSDPRADPLKVIVTGFRADAENLLEFLSRDALRSAGALAGFEPLARELLHDKAEDPVAAVAAAYFLLRTQGWLTVPPHWFDNLFHLFPWIPDTAAILCAVSTRAGLDDARAASARGLLDECLRRGLPVYAEGLLLLQEAASVLRPARRGGDDGSAVATIDRLAASSAWAGSALSFYGRAPDVPSPEKFVGPPGDGRPEKGARGADPAPSGALPGADSTPRPPAARRRAGFAAGGASAGGPPADAGFLYLGGIGS